MFRTMSVVARSPVATVSSPAPSTWLVLTPPILARRRTEAEGGSRSAPTLRARVEDCAVPASGRGVTIPVDAQVLAMLLCCQLVRGRDALRQVGGGLRPLGPVLGGREPPVRD